MCASRVSSSSEQGRAGRHGLRGNGRSYPIPAKYPRGRYLLVFDPLDGSSNSDVKVSVGTIFSIFARSTAGDAEAGDYLRPGNEQVAAGCAIYGPLTMMVLALGNGTHGFTLDREAAISS